MSEKRSGEYQLSCGHTVKVALDVEQRLRCPSCGADSIVLRVVR